ncbi:beta strand repeat-containing protein [Hymenobacter cellulosivorans]|uniref:T9SS type A sorting domain-containing protein n=1 Tax=Hymenobacter cellulosivorans TaxID=2932249 RepID=A0ABY4FCT1_9BACT|nr:T9SS type A sorting domain-containing protein [Hymenobacter cellulosivorans]UOQ54474.1 T9SS type A sorting domain-containing protein [Hymenobacter cellulosivorans]
MTHLYLVAAPVVRSVHRLLASRLLALLVLLLPWAARAQTLDPKQSTPSVGAMLNPDGTLRPGGAGSFDARGYRMSLDSKTGGPVFRPAGAGDENWQDGFGLPGTNGTIYAVARATNGDVYVGGEFTGAGAVAASRIARWNGTAWSALGDGSSLENNGLNGRVLALAVSSTGELYAGGYFTQARNGAGNTVPVSNIAKWSNGAWSALGDGINNQVDVLAVATTGELYAGGIFTQARTSSTNTVAASRVAKWSNGAWSALGDGSTITGNGIDNRVLALAVSSTGELYVGGIFTQARNGAGNTVPVSNIAKWSNGAWSALGDGSNINNNGVNTMVSSLAVSSAGELYVGGNFSEARTSAFNTVPASAVAKWSNGAWTVLGQRNSLNYNGVGIGPTGSGTVFSLALGNAGEVYVSGVFTHARTSSSATVPASRVAKWSNGAWTVLGESTSVDNNGVEVGQVNAIAVGSTGELYMGGSFSQARTSSTSTVPVNNVAQWSGATWNALGADHNGVNGNIQAVVRMANGDVYIGGQFTGVGTVPASYIAKWNGTAWSALGDGSALGSNGVNSEVNALALGSAGELYVGGLFTRARTSLSNSIPVSYVAKWSNGAWSALGDGGTATGNGANNQVSALAVSNTGEVYVGGVFSQVRTSSTSTLPASRVAKWSNGTWSTLGDGSSVNNNGVTGTVSTLALGSAGELYVGGEFNQARSSSTSTLPVSNIAKWSNGAWSALGDGSNINNNGTNSHVYTLAVATTGELYVGGNFSQVRTSTGSRVAAKGIARWNGTVWSALGDGSSVDGNGVNGAAFALVFGDAGELYVGGIFTQARTSSTSTVAANNVAIWNGTAWSTLGAGVNGSVRALAVSGKQITAGGLFLAVGDNTKQTAHFGIYTAAATNSLVVSTGTLANPTVVPAGTYTSVTVTGIGVAVLTGGISVSAAVNVQSGGVLLTNCQPLTGAATFTLAARATLGICDPAGLSTTPGAGAVQTTGTRSFSPEATYIYNGLQAQVTGTALPAIVGTLDNANGGGPVQLSQPTSISRELRLTTGTLNLNAQALTLLSDATTTAQVNQDGRTTTGTVTGGNVTVQRFVPANGNAGLGYRHLASPVSGNSLADLTVAGGFQPVFNAGYNSSATSGLITPFPTVFGFDPARIGTAASSYTGFDQGWYSPAAGNGPDNFLAGRGYTVNLAANQMVDFVGALNQAAVSVVLPRAAGTATPDDSRGWHLLGNPFASSFALSSLDSTAGVDNAKYVFQSTGPYAGGYDTYLTGLSGQPLLAVGQGFFVRTSTPGTTPTLTFAVSGRRVDFTTNSTFHRAEAKTRPLLELALTNAAGTLRDRTTLYADARATTGLDASYDAVKLANPHGLNLSQTTVGPRLALNGVPAFGPGTVVPLAVGVPVAGTYALLVNQLLNLPAGTAVMLVDTELNTRTDLATLPAAGYTFSVTATQATALLTDRFYLSVSATALATTAGRMTSVPQLYPNPTTGAVLLSGVQPGASVQVLDVRGRVVLSTTADATGAARLALPAALSAGVYVVRAGQQAVRLVRE